MFFVIVAMLAMGFYTASAATADASKAKETSTADASDETLSAEEMHMLTLRVEEIRDMDKSNMTALEKT